MTRHASTPRLASTAALTTVLALAAASAQADPSDFRPGAPGVGDTYYPGYGNGGYDVSRYRIDLTYHPTDNHIEAQTIIDAEATQDLSRFNLDLVGLTVRSIEVDGHAASWSRSGQELSVTPPRGLREGREFQTVVRYDGVPVEFVLPGTDVRTGFMATDDGATVAGQPEVAASWFPANDHPRDKAAYDFVVAVPDGHEVVANGVLQSRRSHQGWTTFTWRAAEPMAPYLATIDIGQWDVRTWKTAERPAGLRRRRPGPGRRPRARPCHRRLAQAPGRDRRRPRRPLRPVPVPHRRGHRRRPGRPVLRARDPDPAGVLPVLLAGRRRLRGRPRAGTPVVRGRRRPGPMAGHLAQRGLRHLCRVALGGARGPCHPRGDRPVRLRPDPRRRPVLGLADRRPGRRAPVRRAGVRPGRDGATGAARRVGDQDFWRIIRTWAASRSGGTGTTPQLVALAERISGTDLGPLFDAWLYTGAKPAAAVAASGAARATFGTSTKSAHASSYARQWLAGLQQRAGRGR